MGTCNKIAGYWRINRLAGKAEVSRRADVIVAAMHMNASAFDLKELELCYAP